MSVMIDTQVLSYAISKGKHFRNPTEVAKRMVRASCMVLAKESIIRVSAVTWFEIHRNANPDQVTFLKDLYAAGKIKVLPLDGASAQYAAEVLNKHYPPQNACARCLNTKKTKTCEDCKAKIPKQQRIADGLIVATAAMNRYVTKLYAYDTGVLGFADAVTGCVISEPPDPDGELFQHMRGKAAETAADDSAIP